MVTMVTMVPIVTMVIMVTMIIMVTMVTMVIMVTMVTMVIIVTMVTLVMSLTINHSSLYFIYLLIDSAGTRFVSTLCYVREGAFHLLRESVSFTC